jgi:hypothetical protein
LWGLLEASDSISGQLASWHKIYENTKKYKKIEEIFVSSL